MIEKRASEIRAGDVLLVPAGELHEDLAGLPAAKIHVRWIELNAREVIAHYREDGDLRTIRWRRDEIVTEI